MLYRALKWGVYLTLFSLALFFLALFASGWPITHSAFSASSDSSPSMRETRQTELQDLMSHIGQGHGEELLLLLHDLGQKDPAILTNLHDCARKNSPSPTKEGQANLPPQEDFIKICQKELSAYTELCLKRYAALPCSESAASLMLHGATTREPLNLP